MSEMRIPSMTAIICFLRLITTLVAFHQSSFGGVRHSATIFRSSIPAIQRYQPNNRSHARFHSSSLAFSRSHADNDFDRDKKKKSIQLLYPFRRFLDFAQGKLKTFMFSLLLLVASLFLVIPSDAATSGGRMGGSFNSKRRYASSATPHRTESFRGRPLGGTYLRTHIGTPSTQLRGSTYDRSEIITGPISYVVPIAITTGIIYIELRKANRLREQEETTINSPLGPGVSVLKMSVALFIVDRDDSNCILQKLKDISNTAETHSREGVQNLLSTVCFELSRQQDHTVAANAEYDHFLRLSDAERAYANASLHERSKFLTESVNRFGKINVSSIDSMGADLSLSKSSVAPGTWAIVTILLSIEGNKTKPDHKISAWHDVRNLLSRISKDASVEDCLLSAEVLWTPEQRKDSLSKTDIDMYYPDLRLL